jgi:hypothetical protein
MTFNDLIAELGDDPAGLGYAGKSPDAVLALMHAASRDGSVPAVDVRRYMMTQGTWGSLRVAASDPATPAPVRALAFTAIDAVNGGFEQCDLADPVLRAQIEALMGGLQQAGLITAAQIAAILAMREGRRSRLEELGWPAPTAWAIQQAQEALTNG